VTGNDVAARQFAELRSSSERPPRLGCELASHRDLGFCAGCHPGGVNYELLAWRLLALAERGVPDQPAELL
jgi:hypothetical protein